MFGACLCRGGKRRTFHWCWLWLLPVILIYSGCNRKSVPTVTEKQNAIRKLASTLPPGQHTITVTATDAAGNIGTSSVTVTVINPTPSMFVAMPPCRLFDSRNAVGTFGGPRLVAGLPARTIPVQSVSPLSPCPVPSTATAYSLNITAVPPGEAFPGAVNPTGALGYLTAGPTPILVTPNFSTLNSYLGTVVVNAAIVPVGTAGSIDLYVSNNTDAVVDINGYFAP